MKSADSCRPIPVSRFQSADSLQPIPVSRFPSADSVSGQILNMFDKEELANDYIPTGGLAIEMADWEIE